MKQENMLRDKATAFYLPIIQPHQGFLLLLRPYTWYLTLGCTLLLVTNAISVLLPRLINGGVSIIEKKTGFLLSIFGLSKFFSNIEGLILIIIAFALLGAVIRTLSRMVIFDVGRSIERDLRAKLFSHLTIMDDEFFKTQSVGELINHLTTDITNIRLVTGFAALNIMNIVFIFIFTVPLLFAMDVVLALCALLPFPLVILATSGISKKTYKKTKQYQSSLDNLVSHVQENLLGASVVRLFHQQVRESDRFSIVNDQNYESAIDLARVRVFLFPVMRLVIGLSVGLVLLAGSMAIIAKRISVGDFVEINTRILQLTWPAMSIGFVLSVYHRSKASLSRINELLAKVPTIVDGPKNISTINNIRVNKLNLELVQGWSLTDISFSLNKGQLLGIVGSSGSFKSSLLKAIYHRLKVPYGSIFIDGHDINDISLSSLYQNLSIVSEEPFLFHLSIRENICLANPKISNQELIKVVDLVRLTNDIALMKDGLDTIIGERGITLSGGQRQRVALARALIANRPVLILDDALSALDTETESQIINSLAAQRAGLITIIATHRLSTIKHADEILVLEQGRVLERGKHNELIKHGKIYPELWGKGL